ncbi:glycoside hydrolase family 6 protein [Nonomuraea aurantiaca]|uniref:glycoside hydrolase family 6 protein n=1 Tax=Nonomuraea aurantiaca TaxID=2878562 RepID=UPI001CD9659D|nr:glycoside hydrolase family 6 protein [Nonomuraea aurantiaca]MCA2225258.1 glycoside hydrolase family 6 protein [Nonomuraea aurantiaca]
MAHGTKHGDAVDGTIGGDPRRVGGHRIIRRLGAGGMGVVYLAEGGSRTLVAIKVIHRHLAGDPEFRRRFRREVATAQRVARFSTAPVLEADLDGDLAYVVTEYVPGPTLYSAVKEWGPMAGSELEGLAMSMAVALGAIHAAGVVHRDLKPSNVLLSPAGPKVIDFGLAFAADSTTLSVTRMGTPAYMSPEQVRGLPLATASDVFAWGGVVVFAACGQPPFGYGAGHEVLYRVVHDDPVLPKLEGVLGELVPRALSKDPGARPTAAELVEAFAEGPTTRLPPAATVPPTAAAAPPAAALAPADALATEPRLGARPPAPVSETSADALDPQPPGASFEAFGAEPAGGDSRSQPTTPEPGGGVVAGAGKDRRRRRRATSRRRVSRRRRVWGGAALALVTAGAIVTSLAITHRAPLLPGPSARPADDPAVAQDAGTRWRKLPGENPLRAAGVRFYAQPDTDAARQARTWSAQGRTADAALMRSLSEVPQAIWLSGGSPADISRTVRETVTQADQQRTVPVFVTNNIPGRDCWNGGAPNTATYRTWIDAVAEGIGNRPAVVALEPSALARLPGSPECPQGGEIAAVQRYADLSYAVETLTGLAGTAVYLDGGLAGWPAFTQIADRLVNAGAVRADGFYVNAVGYRPTARSLAYAAKLSRCVYLRAASRTTSCADAALAAVPDAAPGLPHFVIDTSRNGTGEWQPPAGRFPAPDEWCNPPGRGAGARPTADTGSPLADASLWLNSPGFSNGQCTRGTSGPADPAYGIVTPAAGQWWPDQALERARNAVPPLRPSAP